ncbi:unnamed protein product [Moneuplotes crassus]|uniref:Uncharacterized protein n=1 Tax=Euplotes crassus TaxID=5936 RepID=A0AAD1U3Z6_EUPCR|nr:unnamed protein product [Moneuplotes crassus]
MEHDCRSFRVSLIMACRVYYNSVNYIPVDCKESCKGLEAF